MTTLGKVHIQRKVVKVVPNQEGWVLKEHQRGTDLVALNHLTNHLKVPMDKAFAIIHREPQQEVTARFLRVHGYEFIRVGE